MLWLIMTNAGRSATILIELYSGLIPKLLGMELINARRSISAPHAGPAGHVR